MSAYMVDREHIRYLLEAAIGLTSHGPFMWVHIDTDGEPHHYWLSCMDREAMGRTGQMLWDANMASIEARYPDTIDNPQAIPGPCGESYIYYHEPSTLSRIDPVQVLASCNCYEYQSCEYDGWLTSEARSFIQCLRKQAISALPGMDEAAWGAPASMYRSTH